MCNPIIEIKNLSKTYKNGVIALHDFNLNINQGDIITILGENGAGKSTLIHILTTFLTPTKGHIKINNYILGKDNLAIKKHISCVFQETTIDDYLSLKDNMLFQAKLYQLDKDTTINRISKLIKQFQLEQYLDYPIRSFSGGIKRKLDIALNLISMPKILFLDEPTTGLDINARRELWQMIQEINQTMNTTIILTTHYLDEAESLSHKFCFIKDGLNYLEGTLSSLKTLMNKQFIEIIFENKKQADIAVSKLSTENKIVQNNHVIKVISEYPSIDIQKITLNIINLSFLSIQPTLEDIFNYFIKEEQYA